MEKKGITEEKYAESYLSYYEQFEKNITIYNGGKVGEGTNGWNQTGIIVNIK